MRRVLFLLFLLLAASAFAQNFDGTLPAGSNTLKALHFKNYPGLGIYSPSVGVMFIGDETGNGITCTVGSGCTSSLVVPSDQGNDGTQYLARLPQAAISIQ